MQIMAQKKITSLVVASKSERLKVFVTFTIYFHMVLNKIKFKKKNILQISFSFLGIVLVFLIYFSKPEKKG